MTNSSYPLSWQQTILMFKLLLQIKLFKLIICRIWIINLFLIFLNFKLLISLNLLTIFLIMNSLNEMQDNPNIKKLNVTTQILLKKLHTGNINKSYSHIDHTVYIIIFTNEKLNNAKCSQKESQVT